jgi:nucleoside-diphosphate-sugar epimerase
MRIFVAGASGVIGRQLVPLLAADGHQITGMTRTPAKVDLVRELSAEPVVCDVFDAGALRTAIVAFRPEIVLSQLTDLPDESSRLAEFADANSRIRLEGTRNLLAAANSANVRGFLAQSIAWKLPDERQKSLDEFEQMVLSAGGVVLRYGVFYGPGTYHEATLPARPRIEVADAARRTVLLLGAPSGVIEIAD